MYCVVLNFTLLVISIRFIYTFFAGSLSGLVLRLFPASKAVSHSMRVFAIAFSARREFDNSSRRHGLLIADAMMSVIQRFCENRSQSIGSNVGESQSAVGHGAFAVVELRSSSSVPFESTLRRSSVRRTSIRTKANNLILCVNRFRDRTCLYRI